MTTYVVQPGPGVGRDTYISSRSPDQNYGSDSWILAGDADSSFPDTLRILLAMPIDIPLGPREVIRVTNDPILRLRINASAPNTTTLHYHMITEPWDHQAVTWNTQPSTGPSLGSQLVGTGTNIFVQLQLPRSLVEHWVNEENHGLMLRKSNETGTANDYKQFRASRYSTVDHRPLLTFDYEIVTRQAGSQGRRGYNAPIIGRRGRGIFTF